MYTDDLCKAMLQGMVNQLKHDGVIQDGAHGCAVDADDLAAAAAALAALPEGPLVDPLAAFNHAVMAANAQRLRAALALLARCVTDDPDLETARDAMRAKILAYLGEGP